MISRGGKAGVSLKSEVTTLSLLDLYPNSIPPPLEHVFMVLKCYFDGGNKADSTSYDYVTLAVLAGTVHQWGPFEKAWTRNLHKHGAPWLHTTDAVTGNSPYSRKDGWTRKKIDAFVYDCVRIAGKYIARPITKTDTGRIGIYPYTVTVCLKDFIRARKDNKDVPPSVDEILSIQAINACFTFGKKYAMTSAYSLVYDQHEPFRGHVIDRQRNTKACKAFPLFKQIVSNTEANARYTPALQLADLFAYCYSHKRDKGEKFKWHEKMLRHPHDEAVADYGKLMRPIVKMVELSRAMKFARRVPTR